MQKMIHNNSLINKPNIKQYTIDIYLINIMNIRQYYSYLDAEINNSKDASIEH